MRWNKHITDKTPSIFATAITTALLTITIAGGITGASAASKETSTPPVSPVSSTAVNDPTDLINGSVCGDAPATTAKAKFKVFKDTQNVRNGANDRIMTGGASTWWDTDIPEYSTSINAKATAGTNTKITLIMVCKVTLHVTRGAINPDTGYADFYYDLISARWETVFKHNGGKKVVSVPVQMYSMVGDPMSDSYEITFMASSFYGARGNGTSVPTEIGGGCCFGK